MRECLNAIAELARAARRSCRNPCDQQGTILISPILFNRAQQFTERFRHGDAAISFMGQDQFSMPSLLVLDLNVVPEHVRPNRLIP